MIQTNATNTFIKADSYQILECAGRETELRQPDVGEKVEFLKEVRPAR
jgi:hypothetical protein